MTDTIRFVADPASTLAAHLSDAELDAAGGIRIGGHQVAWLHGDRLELGDAAGGPRVAQLDKQGLVLDERFNHGGQAADYVIDVLRRSC